MTFLDRLERATEASSALCAGIDPSAALLETWGLCDDARGARELGMRVVDACAGRVGVVKPQVAFYERFGAAGFAALEDVLAAARASGLLVIADAKRGDIGSTADGYAEAWLAPGSPLEADAVTASPYLGVGALDPLLATAARHDKGVFVLVATSNPEARALQTAARDGARSVAAGVLDELRVRVGTGSAGAVIGATVALDDYGIAAHDLRGIPVLAPGFGAQGARLADARTMYGPATAVFSVSRSILGGGAAGLEGSLDAARAELAGSDR